VADDDGTLFLTAVKAGAVAGPGGERAVGLEVFGEREAAPGVEVGQRVIMTVEGAELLLAALQAALED
jgi:hypothetical protein